MVRTVLRRTAPVELHDESDRLWDIDGLALVIVVLWVGMRRFEDSLAGEVDAFTGERLQAVEQVEGTKAGCLLLASILSFRNAFEDTESLLDQCDDLAEAWQELIADEWQIGRVVQGAHRDGLDQEADQWRHGHDAHLLQLPLLELSQLLLEKCLQQSQNFADQLKVRWRFETLNMLLRLMGKLDEGLDQDLLEFFHAAIQRCASLHGCQRSLGLHLKALLDEIDEHVAKLSRLFLVSVFGLLQSLLVRINKR